MEPVWQHSVVEWIRLLDGVRVVEEGGRLSLVHPWGTLSLASMEPAIADALRTLVDQYVELSTVERLVAAADPVGLAHWYLVLDVVRGLFVHELRLGGTPLVRSIPLAADAVHRRAVWPPDAAARLSRFAVVRRLVDATTAESPLSFRLAVLDDPVVREVVGALTVPTGRAGLAAAVPGVDPAVAERIAEFLAACGLLRFVAQPPEQPVDGWPEPDLAPWRWEPRPAPHTTRCRQRRTWPWNGRPWSTCSRAPWR